MDWSNKDWEIEDKLYSPKREVDNSKSHYMPHLSGHLPSYKMNRQIGYESFWGECLFYYYLELDPLTVRYYEQPVEIPIVNVNDLNEITVWNHVPDVLVFRQGSKPFLFQIKGSDGELEINPLIELKCREFSNERDWIYMTIQPKKLPEVIKSNILILSNYFRPRSYYSMWEKELLQKIKYQPGITILELAKSFSGKVDYRMILPLIYHLIAKGQLKTNIDQQINDKSTVTSGSIISWLENLF